jgi:hypothetical protein
MGDAVCPAVLSDGFAKGSSDVETFMLIFAEGRKTYGTFSNQWSTRAYMQAAHYIVGTRHNSPLILSLKFASLDIRVLAPKHCDQCEYLTQWSKAC